MVTDTAKVQRVLVVEDDPAISMLITRALEQQYDVTAVADGNAAVQQATEDKPDLILLDVNLPGMDGFEVCQSLKSDARFRRTPVIFVTARDRPADTIKGIQAGARHYIFKPFRLEDLMSKVRRALMGSIPPPAATNP
ncbi:MAG TPA: response regulator [Polyangiaceae bacterium]|nr:response regulator [Polyangiaceae bacterium]